MGSFGGKATATHSGNFASAIIDLVSQCNGSPMAAAILTVSTDGAETAFMHGSPDHSPGVTAALQFALAKLLIENMQAELKLDQFEFLIRALNEAQKSLASVIPCICGQPDCPNAPAQ